VIPRAFIDRWRSHAPWRSDAQVEQDLLICRALVNDLLPADTDYDFESGFAIVERELVARL